MRKIDKRDRAQLFRERLAKAMEQSGMNQSALARQIGVDRSTVSQLLAPQTTRLPNAQVVGECARSLGVSADWLLGLTELPELAADLIAAAMTMTAAPRALVDEQIFAWHKEAAGYKIRHVPAGLPDMLKTPDLLRWEYSPELGRTTEQAIGASEDRLNYMRSARSDFEIAIPLHEVSSFAFGEGYYRGLSAQLRLQQIDRILALHRQLYPAVRITLFDARRLYSAPITVFGPLLAVIYLGRNYLAFRDPDRIAALTTHFNQLVREADITDRDIPAHLMQLREQIA